MGDDKANIQGRTKQNMALQLLMAAASFTRKIGEIEKINTSRPLGIFYDEITSNVTLGNYS